MTVRGALAGLLLRGPAHGYELHSLLEGELGPVWFTRHSQLYLTLGRLQREGLVVSRAVAQQRRPLRQVLSLTDAGERFARAWIYDQGPPEEIVVRLAVARISIPGEWPDLLTQIHDQETRNVRTLRQLRSGATAGFQREALEAEIGRAEADLRWLGSLRDRVAEILTRPVERVARGHFEVVSGGYQRRL